MGICSSCLGLGRRPSDAERSESSHLLGDPYPPYGTHNAPSSQSLTRPDPEEIRRQRDALERICAQTNDKLIDVSQATYADDGSKIASEYPRLFNERFPPQLPQSSRPASASADTAPHDSHMYHQDAEPSANTSAHHDYEEVMEEEEEEAAWLSNIVGNSADPEGNWGHVQPIESGALTFQFGDPLVGDKRSTR
ncbi:hypothetical protein B0J11DRAFT_70608 [Dendryphion nanum]|uniref:Late endosomal/lysosomal adaptor and MAPK and MTOR activator 1 n=1 Tax=Dendryphion nanum TaxID=256645 RepID=A0A9P9DIJ2_9PLEO|nr:hypothetical protein B0J11DRAFT_70608 [Dendryphion nanum]